HLYVHSFPTRRSSDLSDGHALAQIPPLEGTLEVGYRGARVSGAVLVRLVDEQDRIAVNQGNIVGQDIGPSDGFAVASLHASYRLDRKSTRLNSSHVKI